MKYIYCVIVFCIIAMKSSFSYGNDELIVALNALPISLDPANISDYESVKISNAIYEGLVRYRGQTSEIEPCLSVSWSVSFDGLVWTFRLRDNVFFHDGTLLDAASVVFSYKRQFDASHEYYNSKSKYANFALGYIEDVYVADRMTVVIRLKKPYAPFLANLAMPMAAPIVSPAAVVRYGADFERYPVGTGPFRMQGSDGGDGGDDYVLDRFDRYWGGCPGVSRLKFRVINNTALRFEEFQRGAVHIIDNLRPADIPKVRQLQDAVLVRRPGMNVAYLAMNTRKKPFDNVLVRRAVNHAINKERLIRYVYQGAATPAATPVPPTVWGHNSAIEDYAYDPEKARQLLDSAGYGSGFSTEIYVMTTPRPYMPDPIEVARIIQQNLSALQIRAAIVSYPWKEFLERVDNGEHDMCLLGWVGDNGDPDNFLYVLLDEDNMEKPASMNRAFFSDGEMHGYLLRAQMVTDMAERSSLYAKVQEIVHDQAPWVPLAYADQYIAVKSFVSDLIYNVNGSYCYHGVSLSHDQ